MAMRRVNYVSFNDKTSIPYVGPIGHELVPWLEIELNLFIYPTARRFAINLQCGPNVSPRDDVALHFSPDFDRMIIIRNNILMNNWGPEESTGSFPFIKGQNCRICFLYDHDKFKIVVDGHELTSFVHRIPPSRISHLALDGDINLTSIEVRISSGTPSVYPGSVGAPPTNIGFNPNPTYSASPYPQGQPPYPVGGAPPYPVGGAPPYPVGGPSPYPVGGPNSYPNGMGYPSGPAYPSGGVSPYPVQPGLAPAGYPQGAYHPPSPNLGYHGTAAYPQQPGMHGAGQYPVSPGYNKQKGSGPLDKAGAVLGTMAAGGLVGGLLKKGGKKMSKKKALKYGLPIAGAGIGAYALSKTFKHGKHHGSSSSSSSSSGSWSS